MSRAFFGLLIFFFTLILDPDLIRHTTMHYIVKSRRVVWGFKFAIIHKVALSPPQITIGTRGVKINPGVQQTWLGGTPQGARLGVALLPTNSQPMMMVMTMIFPVKWQPPVPKQSQFQIFDEKMSSFSSFFA